MYTVVHCPFLSLPYFPTRFVPGLLTTFYCKLEENFSSFFSVLHTTEAYGKAKFKFGKFARLILCYLLMWIWRDLMHSILIFNLPIRLVKLWSVHTKTLFKLLKKFWGSLRARLHFTLRDETMWYHMGHMTVWSLLIMGKEHSKQNLHPKLSPHLGTPLLILSWGVLTPFLKVIKQSCVRSHMG